MRSPGHCTGPQAPGSAPQTPDRCSTKLTFPPSHLLLSLENGTTIPRFLGPNLGGFFLCSLSHPTSNLLANPTGFTFKCSSHSPPLLVPTAHLTQAPQGCLPAPSFCPCPDSHFSKACDQTLWSLTWSCPELPSPWKGAWPPPPCPGMSRGLRAEATEGRAIKKATCVARRTGVSGGWRDRCAITGISRKEVLPPYLKKRCGC